MQLIPFYIIIMVYRLTPAVVDRFRTSMIDVIQTVNMGSKLVGMIAGKK